MLLVAFEDDWGTEKKYINRKFYDPETDKFYQAFDKSTNSVTILYAWPNFYQAFLVGEQVSDEQRPMFLEKIQKHKLKRNLKDHDIMLNNMIPIKCIAYCNNQDIKSNTELLTPNIYSGPFNQDLATARKHTVTEGKFDLIRDAFELCCTKCDTLDLSQIMDKANPHDETYLRFIHVRKIIDCVAQRDTGIEEKACEDD